MKSERPWGNDVFAAKDALAEIARTAGVLGPRDKFNGADQSEELRDVLNATTETRGVQLVQQPNGGVGVAQSLGANPATADP